MIHIPVYGEETPFQYGVRITNNSLIPYRFELPKFVPEILNPHGKLMQMSFGQNNTRKVKESDIPLIMPGESLASLMDTKFSWYNKNCLQLSGYALYGGILRFYNFKPTKYQIRLTYESPLVNQRRFMFTGKPEIDDFWIGTIVTPLVKFRLR